MPTEWIDDPTYNVVTSLCGEMPRTSQAMLDRITVCEPVRLRRVLSDPAMLTREHRSALGCFIDKHRVAFLKGSAQNYPSKANRGFAQEVLELAAHTAAA